MPQLRIAKWRPQRSTRYLIAGKYDHAHELLSLELAEISAEDLRESFEAMTFADEENAEIDDPQICVMSVDRNFPGMSADDLGSVYVAISGEQYNEAISVLVTVENGEARIRELEWGHP